MVFPDGPDTANIYMYIYTYIYKPSKGFGIPEIYPLQFNAMESIIFFKLRYYHNDFNAAIIILCSTKHCIHRKKWLPPSASDPRLRAFEKPR